MVDRIALETTRLRLRNWHDEDLEALTRLCADPEVMRYQPSLMSRDESAALMVRSRLGFLRHGFGLWVVERKDDGAFIGYCGLAGCSLPLPEPSLELLWRVACEHWGQGLAHEAAQAVLRYAFETLELAELVVCTAQINEPARQLIEGLGMRAEPATNILHPGLPAAHPLRQQLLYRAQRDDWRQCSLLLERCRRNT
ncbi:GNAT family N-acetyltransferase [Pseudomonas stutzeri]|uniref:GNAT family N-acetyltransferase n=1 Tax=Stutzerimonas stutzeri TaxID=316 RepID=UPI00190C8A77|nr:GNAT family N-acetyltransferase [Stutzerimonas stutzeri]MBK3868505.1 GNAT family N-acetyltransferase [Stutzerimonas stutzeri]